MGDAPIPTSYLQALFDFANRVGGEDATPAQPSQVSAEDREWLSRMMRDLVKETDPVGHMRRHLDALAPIDLYQPQSPEEEATAVEALEGLIELAENVDDAQNFEKIGGFKLTVPLLRSTSASLRRLSAELLAVAAQNHPYVQQKLHQAGVVPLLLEVLTSDPDVGVRTKALLGLSSLLGSVEYGEVVDAVNVFRKRDGASKVIAAAKAPDADGRLRAKALFFLASLGRQGGAAAEALGDFALEAARLAAQAFADAPSLEDNQSSQALQLLSALGSGEGVAASVRSMLLCQAAQDLLLSTDEDLKDSRELLEALRDRFH